MFWTFPQVNVGTVGTVDMAANRTAKLIDRLAMIRSAQTGIADHHLAILLTYPMLVV